MDKQSALIKDQISIAFSKAEYEAIGMDLNDIQYDYLLNAGLKMIGVALIAMISTIIVCLLAAKVAAKIGMNLRSRVFKKVVTFSSVEMDRFSTASLITRSTNDIQQVQMVSVLLLRMVFYAPILGFGGVIKVLNTETSMAWIIFAAVAVIMVIVGVLFVVAMPKFKRMQVLVDRVNLVTREILTGLPVIRAFSTDRHEEKRFDEANTDLTRNALFTTRTMAIMMPFMFFIMNVVTIVIIWFGAKGIDQGNLQVGDMMAFLTYTFQIVISFLMLTMISIMLPRAAVAANRIDEILNTELTIKNPEVENKLGLDVQGVVEFDHVNFRYPNAEDDALEDITFTARPGQTTAFIGSTGCGKSTLINLIPRLYDVTSGSVRIDGVDVREISQHDLREQLGYVPQKGVLFTGTIDSNIRFGNKNATEDVVKKAAKIAQATDFIEEKPEGYESDIAQGGNNVSGGQKQRLSIARAIAKQPKIYIFDDSFSALDYKTDVTLRKALKEEMGDSTVLIVAQRISTIMHADQIIVIDDGKIAGIGTHDELLADNEVYQQIASSQLSSEELEKHSNKKEGGKSNE
jgi:ATP-binding cassette subfamily B protein